MWFCWARLRAIIEIGRFGPVRRDARSACHMSCARSSDLIERYGLSQTRFSQAVCASLIPTLIHKIAEQAVPDPPTDTRSLTTYQRLRVLLDQEFLTLKNIEQAAQRCRVSVSYACRLFKRFDHMTPYQYLMRHKMKFAADLLSHPDVLVKQVAIELEFADQYQFSRKVRSHLWPLAGAISAASRAAAKSTKGLSVVSCP